MGKRILLLKQEAIGYIFAPRGEKQALLISVSGPHIADDTQAIGMLLFPEKKAVGIVLESPAWSDLLTPGNDELAGGLQPLPDPALHFHTMLVDIEPQPAEEEQVA